MNIIIPVVLAIVLLALLNHYRVQNTALKNNEIQNQLISDQIELSLVHQDDGLNAIEKNLETQLQAASNRLVNDVFQNTEGIEFADLTSIRDGIGMESEFQDIYIIDRNGTIVNTTFAKDLNRNLFEIGDKFKEYLVSVFNAGGYVSEKFSIEMKTGKIRKYTYHPTIDGKYLIQTGTYSFDADAWINKLSKVLVRTITVSSVLLTWSAKGFWNGTLFSTSVNPPKLDFKLEVLFLSVSG